MKRIVLIVIFLLQTLTLVACENKVQTSYTKYHLYQGVINENSYYKINTVSEFNDFNNKYLKIGSFEKNYDEEFFNSNSLLAFLISEGSGGNRFELVTKDISDDGILSINYELTNLGDTCDMAYWVVLYELPSEIVNNINKIKIISKNYEIILNNIDNFKTKYPLEMANNTRLFMSWNDGYNFSYDSSDSELYNKYNNKITLILTDEELTEIYHILRDIEFDSYPETITISNDGKFNAYISLYNDTISSSCQIYNIPSYDITTWQFHQEIGNALTKILNDYIYDTDEYKELLNNITS